MNFKIVYTFFLFVVTSIVSAQNTSGKVVYSVSLEPIYQKVLKNSRNNTNSPSVKNFSRITKAASHFQCKLEFNKQQSLFFLINPMAIGDDELLLTIAKGLTTKGDYYTNLIKGIQVLKDNSGKDIYIKSSIDIDWTLTKETKKLGNYLCYKATSYKQLPSSKALVTVWYTPQIPIAFGPKEFVGNLPGLILEYEDNVVHFVANKIVLNPKKPIKIEWPDAKTISQEEHDKQSVSFQQLKESYGRD